MRWACSPALLLAALGYAGCGKAVSAEQREHLQLERALIGFSEAPPEHHRARLEEIRGLSFSSERVIGVRRTCLEAYEAFFAAADRLALVREQAAMVEAESAKAVDPSPAAGDALSRMQTAALQGTREVNAALDRAEALVNECTRARAWLAAELAD